MYYNKLIICGRVLTDPSIGESKTGKNYVTLRVGVKRNTRRKTSEAKYDNFTLFAYGDAGNTMLEKVKKKKLYLCNWERKRKWI